MINCDTKMLTYTVKEVTKSPIVSMLEYIFLKPPYCV